MEIGRPDAFSLSHLPRTRLPNEYLELRVSCLQRSRLGAGMPRSVPKLVSKLVRESLLPLVSGRPELAHG